MRLLKTKNSCIQFNFFSLSFITTKFHRSPVKIRFITCATNSYNFMLVIYVFSLLNKILKAIEEKGNSFIIYNNKPVLDYINSSNSCIKSINTYDFKNLFNSIPLCGISKVYNNIYDEFRSVLNCDKSFWIYLSFALEIFYIMVKIKHLNNYAEQLNAFIIILEFTKDLNVSMNEFLSY